MVPAPFRVVLDANVLFPFTLRDALLRAAADGLFQLYWSEQILDEVSRNLVARGKMEASKAERLLAAMRRSFPEAMVTGYEPLIAVMPNQANDRHVAAAAVKIGAQVIVTDNLRDFDALPDGVEAQSADDFLCNLFDLDAERTVQLLRTQAASYKNPERTVDDLLRGLSASVPEFATLVGAHLK